MIIKKVDWTQFKASAQTFNSNIKYSEKTSVYDLFFSDTNLPFICRVKKTSPANSDQTDFETNFKAASNAPLYYAKRVDTFTAAGDGAVFTIQDRPKKTFSIQVKKTGGVLSWIVELQVSPDGTSFSTIGKHTDAIGDGLSVTVSSDIPALYFKAKCTSFGLGGTNIVSTILGIE